MIATAPAKQNTVRCDIYASKSVTDANGWFCLAASYDDAGFSGSNLERPALVSLTADISAGLIACVVVYEVDRLSRPFINPLNKAQEDRNDQRTSNYHNRNGRRHPKS